MRFDWRDLSTASKLLIAASVLLLIDLFLNWQEACVSFGGTETCGGESGWSGIGFLVGILTLALLAWEVLRMLGMTAQWNLPVAANLVSAALAGGVLLFTIIKFLSDGEFRNWPAWLGLLLAIAIGVGGWMRYREADEAAATRTTTEPPAAPPPAAPTA